jgi:dihydrofolate reductase
MRKVVLYSILSLDGVSDPGEWFTDGGPEMFDNLGRVIGSQDAILLGRTTYDYWADHWPGSDVEPFASFINGTEKHVFTSRPLDTEWENTTVVSSPAAEYVAKLKEGDGGDIGIHGSIQLAQSLWKAGVIDELELVIGAAVAGPGPRLFGDDDAMQLLDLVAVRPSPAGTLFLTYRRAA